MVVFLINAACQRDKIRAEIAHPSALTVRRFRSPPEGAVCAFQLRCCRLCDGVSPEMPRLLFQVAQEGQLAPDIEEQFARIRDALPLISRWTSTSSPIPPPEGEAGRLNPWFSQLYERFQRVHYAPRNTPASHRSSAAGKGASSDTGGIVAVEHPPPFRHVLQGNPDGPRHGSRKMCDRGAHRNNQVEMCHDRGSSGLP